MQSLWDGVESAGWLACVMHELSRAPAHCQCSPPSAAAHSLPRVPLDRCRVPLPRRRERTDHAALLSFDASIGSDRTRSPARARSACCSKLRSAIERQAAGLSLHQLYTVLQAAGPSLHHFCILQHRTAEVNS